MKKRDVPWCTRCLRCKLTLVVGSLQWEDHVADAELLKSIKALGPMTPDRDFAGKVKYIMHTTVGGDPTFLGSEESLVDLTTGEPGLK